MSSRDYLDDNLARLMRAIEPELKLPQPSRQQVRDVLIEQSWKLYRQKAGGANRSGFDIHIPRTVAVLAGAAAVILLVWFIIPRQAIKVIGKQPRVRPVSQTDGQLPQGSGGEDSLAYTDKDHPGQEVMLILEMGQAEDVDGLISVLSSGKLLDRLVAASYLSRIGDARAIKPLRQASGQWPGSATDNPFIAAIVQIQRRIEEAAGENSTGGSSLGAGATQPEALPVVSVLNNPAAKQKIFARIMEGLGFAGFGEFLPQGCEIEGIIYDARGKPWHNVTLNVQDKPAYAGPAEEKKGRIASVISDQKGYYRIKDLPEQMCYLVRSGGAGDGIVRAAVMASKEKTLRLDLGAGHAVSGSVMINGLPLANTLLVLGDTCDSRPQVFEYHATTDMYGRFGLAGVVPGDYSVCYSPLDSDSRIELRTFRMGHTDIDLGVLGGATSSVFVRIQAKDSLITDTGSTGQTNDIEDFDVYLQQTDRYSGGRVGYVERPQQPGEPYVIGGVLPGEYTVILARWDNVEFRRYLLVTPAREKVFVTIEIPEASCELGGTFTNGRSGPLILWGPDRTVSVKINPSDNRSYNITALPAGHYMIADPAIAEDFPIAQFELVSGEVKFVDIGLLPGTLAGKAALYVQAVSEQGFAVVGADIWLEGHDQPVEPARQTVSGQLFIADAGEYTIYASFEGCAASRAAVQLGGGGTGNSGGEDIAGMLNSAQTIIIRLKKQ